MTMGDRIKRATQEAGGTLKGTAGKAAGNQDPQAEGQGDQAAANIRRAKDKAEGGAVGDVLGH